MRSRNNEKQSAVGRAFKNIAIACLTLTMYTSLVRGADAVVSLPSGIPSAMLLGLFENPGSTWMKNSGVPWNARYCYFTKGWVNNWGWGAYDGSWGLNYFKECDSLKTIPCVSYYQVNGEVPAYDESKFLQKCQTDSVMKSYFGDFKILMQRAKEFGKPVYILLEPDGFGYLEQKSNNDPSVKASVASTGMAELAAQPNTVAGWGMAFLAIKKAVGATNALLGIHLSAWASNQDISYYSVTIPLQPEVDKVYTFLSPLGLAPNATGSTYDVLVGDPLDRDADFYRIVNNDGGNHWWDTTASTSINSRSFNRYREWLRLWNVKSGKRWVLWQIPLGNSNHLNVTNTGKPREGYKDNRPEYFLGVGGMQHVQQFADAGVIALLFGAGASGVSSYENDFYTDGSLFMKSRGLAFFTAGGVPIKPDASVRPLADRAMGNSLGLHADACDVYDIRGRKIARLTAAGTTALGKVLPSGRYFVKMPGAKSPFLLPVMIVQ